MAQDPPPFVLPAGVTLRVTEHGLHLAYDGDVELHETPDAGFALVEAGGDLEIRLPRITGSLRAGGTLRIRGDISGGRLHARHVVLGRQRVDCLAITATESITIGAAHITSDAIIAPVIHLDPKAHGRVTVIESRNDRGATKIKGGFSLADYDDMFGNADDFLSARGLSRLSGPTESPRSSTPRTVTPPRHTPLPIDEIEDTGPVPDTLPPATPRTATPRPPLRSMANTGPTINTPISYPPTPPTAQGHPPSAPPPPTPIRRRGEEDEDDPSLSVSFGTMEPMLPDPGRDAAAQAELHQRLADALGRIIACYEGADLPPAVQQLRALVDERDYEALRDDITEVWNGLLGFHQKRGIRPHHQVTHAFNVIHGLVQA